MSQDRFPLLRCLSLVVVVVFAAQLHPHDAKAEGSSSISDAVLIKRLKSIWAGRADEIATAQITFRQLCRQAPLMKISRERTEQVLAGLDLVGRPDDARILSDSLELGIPAGSLCWGTLRLYWEPGGFREFQSYNGKHATELIRDQAGDVVRADHANHQVTISPPGGSRMRQLSLEELRPTLEKGNLKNFRIASRQAGQVTLEVGSQVLRQIIADEESGFISRITRTARQGDLVKVWSFSNPSEFPGGIVFPTQIIFANYMKGHLLNLEVLIVEDAEFNMTPPPAALALAVEKGTNVFDERQGAVAFTQPRQRVANIKKELDDRRGGSNLSTKWSTGRLLFFGATLFLFALLLVVFVRRHVKAALPST